MIIFDIRRVEVGDIFGPGICSEFFEFFNAENFSVAVTDKPFDMPQTAFVVQFYIVDGLPFDFADFRKNHLGTDRFCCIRRNGKIDFYHITLKYRIKFGRYFSIPVF